MAVLAAVAMALGLLAAVASPPAGADDLVGPAMAPAQAVEADPAGPAGRAGAATPTPEGDGQGPGSGDGGALAQWMLAEVAVLVIGCAVWCRRSNRRGLRRTGVSSGEHPVPEPRPAPRFRL